MPPARRRRAPRAHTLLFLATAARAYVWPQDAKFYDSDKVGISEPGQYMYASDGGPWPFTAGESYVLADLKCRLGAPGAKANVSALAFTTEFQLDLNAIDLCREARPGVGHHRKHKLIPVSGDHDSHLKLRYNIKLGGQQYLVLQVCDGFGGGLWLDGSIAFRNPYGFLPARNFGILPFEGARAAAFVIFASAYFILLVANRKALLGIHWAVLACAAVAAAEAAAAFASLLVQNETGALPCCPFPRLVVAQMALEVCRRALTRLVLLLVALGIGSARLAPSKREVFGMVLLGAAYVAASIGQSVGRVKASSEPGGPESAPLAPDLFVLLFDLAFLVWIYGALVSTMDTLQASGQTFKLAKFQRLSRCLGGFVALVSALTAAVFAARVGVYAWPWQLFWLQTVSLEVLNFAVVVSLSVIWRPSARAREIVGMQQLNTDEFDEATDDEEGLELPGLDKDDSESTMV
mmetsp:Transcript_9915/g.29643  ORF Transcript_9915/g.29643 Transcript_9915/m.29643 type:complete len:464 (+) Transcript_9915:188-1579(+)